MKVLRQGYKIQSYNKAMELKACKNLANNFKFVNVHLEL